MTHVQTKTKPSIVALALTAIAWALSGCRQKPLLPASLQAVRAIVVQEAPQDAGQQVSTILAPYASADLAFKSGGLIQSIRQVRGSDGTLRAITMGDHVRAGTELARVRSTEYQERVDQACAQLRQAEAQFGSAQATSQLAQLNFERSATLLDSASTTKQSYDGATERRQSAEMTVQQTQGAVQLAQSEVSQAQLALADTTLRAPFDGVIVDRHVEIGNVISSSSVAFTIVDVHLLKADFTIPDSALGTVRLGQTKELLLDAIAAPLYGNITSVSPTADPQSRVFTVELTISNRTGLARPGMVGTLTLGDGTVKSPFPLIPIGALVKSSRKDGTFSVYVLRERDGKSVVTETPINAGATVGNNIQVTHGLELGQHVVVIGSQVLHDLEQVRVVE